MLQERDLVKVWSWTPQNKKWSFFGSTYENLSILHKNKFVLLGQKIQKYYVFLVFNNPAVSGRNSLWPYICWWVVKADTRILVYKYMFEVILKIVSFWNVAGRVLWNRVWPSLRPSFHHYTLPSVQPFSWNWHGTRNPYEIVHAYSTFDNETPPISRVLFGRHVLFCYWRHHRAVTRLENVRQSNTRRDKMLGFQLSHKHPRDRVRFFKKSSFAPKMEEMSQK